MTYKGIVYATITDTNLVDLLDLVSPGAGGLKFSQIVDKLLTLYA